MKLSFESTILLLFLVLAYFHPSSAKNPCTAHSDCGSCFRANGDCAFCKDEDFSSSGVRLDRCNYANVLKELGCKSLMNVQGEHKFEKEENFTFFRQVSPQKITLNLRPAQTNKFKIKVKPAKGFPVDLYYLMDMSKSMENDLNELNKLGIKIADEIGEITPKYRLAFGSFVDKTVAPFIQPAQLNKPCMLEDNVTPCKPTFGYNHIFDFNDNKTSFQERINQQNISGNLDTPEGGFDALMQVASCNSTLNWEPVDRAHRIVIFVTDATPHIAGDGKLGGIIQPNDGLCHLQISTNDQSTKEYTQSNKQDYPSISKLKSKLKSNDIIPIFAVTENVQSVYKKIVDEWKDMNARIGVLKGDSSNIVELIRKTYSEIITTIRLSDNSPSDIKVFYKADESCPNVIEEGAGCSNITAGDEYGFDVMVTATNCPKGVAQVPTQSFVINIPGLGKIDVDVNLQCECPCEAPGMGVQNSTSCNGTGTFQCGICYCGSGYHGEKCECDNEAEADDTLCIPNNTTDVVCSGAGSCVCGECVCNKRLNAGEFISGRYCECNNYGCDRHDGQLCGGPERGICECGSCKCTDAYLGDNCGQVNCTIAEKNCLDPDNGEVCSGNGVCDCEKCNCEVGYIGKYCQTCVSCETKCGEYKDCIQCVLDNNGPLASNNCTSCAYLDIRLVEYEVEGTCRFQIDENCHYEYDYTQGLNETVIVRKACVVVTNESIPILYIVIGIVAGLIVLAFLLLIIWKIIVTAYDNYEYQKFLKQSKPEFESKNENALYKAPKTVYDNPTYAHNNPYE